MFGYIQPYKPLLYVKDYELYKSVYCSLCKKLGKDYGITARFTLSYDCTFYALLSMALRGECPNIKKGRCVFNITKRCNYCIGDSKSLEMAAALSAVTVYYKLQDDIADSKGIKRFFIKFLSPAVKRWRKKAIKHFPESDVIVSTMLQSQFKTEHDENVSIDKCAEPTAVMLKEIMALLSNDENKKLIYGEFGYFLGKWIYLMDAADDYEKDLVNNNFNPFVLNLHEKNLSLKERQLYINSILNETVSRIIPAFNLMEIKIFKELLENITEKGFGNMQKTIIFDKEEIKKKKKKNFFKEK